MYGKRPTKALNEGATASQHPTEQPQAGKERFCKAMKPGLSETY